MTQFVGLWPLEDRQHPVRRRVRPPAQGERRARDGGSSRRIQTELGRHMSAEAMQQLIDRINADQSRRRASRPSTGRPSRRARRPRSGRASSRRPTRSAAAIARTAMWPRPFADAAPKSRRRPRLRARSGARQGALGEERGAGRRAVPVGAAARRAAARVAWSASLMVRRNGSEPRSRRATKSKRPATKSKFVATKTKSAATKTK